MSTTQSNIQNSKTFFYFPCQKCNGFLSININPNTFLINAKCESDFNHVFNNLYFSTFEQFYMKEKQPYKCSSCNKTFNNNSFYFCKNNDIIFCKYCKSKEEKNNKSCEWKLIEELKCNIHNNNYTKYCELCNKNICSNCEKEKHNEHKTHRYSSIILSKKNIEYTNNKLKEKVKFTNEIIEKLNIWKKETSYNDDKIDRLILNLKNELSFLQKMVYNYNNKIKNYFYQKNMKTIFDYINNGININLKEFLNSDNSEKEKELILNIINDLGTDQKKSTEIQQIENKDILYLKRYENDNNLLIEKINDSYFILSTKNSLNLISIFKKKIKILSKINFTEKIYSMTISPDDNQIYICLLNFLKIKIIDYNLELKTIRINNDSISIDSFRGYYFLKCVKINNYFITSNEKKILIWYKNIESNKFEILKSFELNTLTSDLLSIDNDSFISSQPGKKKLTIFDSNNFNQLKIIKNIDCVDYLHCLFKTKNRYIIINCFNGIGLLLIDTKEIVQYINIENNSFEKQLIFDDKNLIYVLTMDIIQNIKNYNIIIYKINNNSIEYIKKLKDLIIDPLKEKYDYQISCNNNTIIYFRDHLHSEIKRDRYIRFDEFSYDSMSSFFQPINLSPMFYDYYDFEDFP